MKDDTFLARWLAGELDNEELKAFAEQQPERYAKLVRIKQHFETIERPEADTETMLSSILAQDKNKVVQLQPRSRRYWIQAVAASIVVLLGLAFFLTRPEKMAAANGTTLAFALPDKTSVQLNSGSEAEFSDRNWDNNRDISLDGEAYFKVAKGKTFTVSTPLGNVVVVGTQFNVKARDKRLEVVCYEGKVRVQYSNHETLLTPGEALYISNSEPARNVKITDTAPAWLHGEMVFNHETLDAITAEIERKFDVDIKSKYTSDKTFTGALPANNINQTLKILSSIYPVKTQQHDKTFILTPADAKR